MITFSTLDLFFFVSPIFLLLFVLRSQKGENTSLKQYFQSEGKLGWFVSGTAMVATTFAADTPLAVTELVRKQGISGNWVWWSLAFGGLTTVFLFAPLWKRSGATTDLELISLRYSGKSAQVLRGFKSIFVGLFLNCIVLGWVNLAMLKILAVFFPEFSSVHLLAICIFLGVVYTTKAGLTGISKIDVFQFFLAWGGCIVYACYLIFDSKIANISSLKQSLPPNALQFFPDLKSSENVTYFGILMFIMWWSSWYPGSEPGGGGYIAQRILATKNEKDAILGSLWFVFAHYFLRPWPWIIIALCSLVLFPNLSENEAGQGFFLPLLEKDISWGLKGLILSAFLAAYLSTLATHLNWGASYIVFDFLKGIAFPGKTDKAYLQVAILVQSVTAILAFILTIYGLDTVKGAWEFLLAASSGLGFVLIARWFYWRISAASEILSLVVSPLLYLVFVVQFEVSFPYSVPCISFSSILIVLLATPFLPATDPETLKSFYQRTKPPFYFWKGFFKSQSQLPFPIYNNQVILSIIGILIGVSFLISGLYCLGMLFLFLDFAWSSVLVFLVSFAGLAIITNRKLKSVL